MSWHEFRYIAVARVKACSVKMLKLSCNSKRDTKKYFDSKRCVFFNIVKNDCEVG